jgi:hypothetical protein
MPTRVYTTEFVKNFFVENGCELLEDQYKHPHTPMKYRCKCGNESRIAWHAFKRGGRCAKCGGTAKPSFEEVFQFFKDNGCELLEKEYINANYKMKFRCHCGKIRKVQWSCFQKSKQCSRCGGTGTFTYQEVCDFYKLHNCELLEKEYKNSITPMKYRCKCGKEHIQSFKSFKKSLQCTNCSGKPQYTYEMVKNGFVEGGCELLEKEYINARYKMRYICKCGRESKITWYKFKNGSRCKECAVKRGKDSPRWNPDREKVRLNEIIAQRSLAILKYILKNNGSKKSKKLQEYVGYSIKDLREHITNHPNWEKVKDGNGTLIIYFQ